MGDRPRRTTSVLQQRQRSPNEKRIHLLVFISFICITPLVVVRFAQTGRWIGGSNQRQQHNFRRFREVSVEESSLLSTQSIERLAHEISVVFPDRSDSSWITTTNGRDAQRLWNGLLFVKVPKCASSTVSGVMLRISKQYGVWSEVEHNLPSTQRYGQRQPSTSYLVATIREPARRIVSEIMYEFSRAEINITQNAVEEHIQSSYRLGLSPDHSASGGSLLHWMELERTHSDPVWSNATPNTVLFPAIIQQNVQKTLAEYDFVLIVERLDESLVAMALSMGLELADIVYATPSKQNKGKNNNTTSYFLNPNGVYDPPAVQARRRKRKSRNKPKGPTCVPSHSIPYNTTRLSATSWWRAMNYGDYLLYAAAHISLDRTIQALGEERFRTALAAYRRLQQRVAEACAGQVHAPCSADGRVQIHLSQQDCYRKDFGCGYPCVDRVLADTATAG